MRRKGNCFVQAEPGDSAPAAVASERSLARRSMRGPGATRLHVLRWALVILCLPRTDGSAASIFVAPHQPSPPPPPPSPPSPHQPGCREDTVEDAFFSTELSSAFFPHSGYTPVPDPDPSECDITIDVPWTAGKSMVQMRDRIIEEGDFKCDAKTSNCATCDLWTWPLVPASCARRPVAICVKPGTYTGITANLIGYKGQQMLIATDASNRPVFDNSAESDLVAWTMEREFRRNHQFINLEFVNTKLVIDKADVKVKGCKFSGGKPESAGSQYGLIWSPPVTNYIVFQPERGTYSALYDISVTNGGEVSGCDFLRSSGFNGLGIEVRRYNLDNYNMGNGRKLRPKNTLIEYNVFGGSDPSLDGYFVTAINDGGDNTIIRHNTIRRFVDVRAASSDKTIVDAAKADQDHGIYSEGAINSKYLGNVIAGWMPEAAGGAFKLDGSQGIELFDNWMATSGILMYSDMNTNNPVPLRDIYIRSNKIYLDHTNISPLHSYDLSVIEAGQQPGDIYRGIGLWIKNPVNYDDDRFEFGASQPDDLSDYSPPEGAGTSIRIESTEVWGPHGLIYFKAHPYADTSAIGEPSDLYSGSGGVFGSLACEIVDQWSVVSVQNSRSLYNDDFATDCALPNPIVECPEPPSLPPQPPPLARPPAQCIVDPEDGAKVCIALPPGQDVNDDTDVVAQAWIQRVLKIDYATRYRLPLAGVY